MKINLFLTITAICIVYSMINIYRRSRLQMSISPTIVTSAGRQHH